MKILHIISSVNPQRGGPIEGVKQLHLPMIKRGIQVDVVCCDDPNAPWLTNTGLTRVIALGPSVLGYAYTNKLIPWLKQNANNYDALIVNGLWQFNGFAVWCALKGSKVPYYVFTHGMLDPWFKKRYPLKHLKKWLYWPWAEYRVLRDARSVIFTCEDERILARDSFWLYKVTESVTSYGSSDPPGNGDFLKEVFLKKYPNLRSKKIVLYLGRIQEKKGCDLLISAFSKLRDPDENIHLVIAGPDQNGWVSSLKKMAAELGVSARITWPGMLSGDLKWGAFYSADVFCLPSHQENFGIVVSEALSTSLPVLISDKVNIWREISQEEVGFVNSDTIDGTLANLNAWFNLSVPAQVAMRERSLSVFRKKFHIDNAAQRLLEIIKGRK